MILFFCGINAGLLTKALQIAFVSCYTSMHTGGVRIKKVSESALWSGLLFYFVIAPLVQLVIDVVLVHDP